MPKSPVRSIQLFFFLAHATKEVYDIYDDNITFVAK